MQISLMIIASLLVTSVHAAPNDTIRDYSVDRIAPNTYVVHGPLGEPSVANQGFMNNPAWVIAGDQVVVIDPGSSVQAGRRVVQLIKKTTRLPVSTVFITHIHGDHWLGNQAILEAWPKATLVAHPDMIAKAQASEGQAWVSMMSRLTQGYTDGTRAVIPTVPTKDGMTSKIGTRTFKIHSSNDAHSKTDIMIEVDNGVLFTGDNVLNKRVARMDDGTYVGTINAIDHALALPTKVIVPGHGKTAGREILTAQKIFLKTLFDAVKKEYDLGKSDFEMKAVVAKKLAAFKNWDNFDASLGKLISLAVLEIEQQ